MRAAVVSTAEGKFRQTVRIGPHTLTADEPIEDEGTDAGPAPHEWLLAGLGSCTSMTVKMYADRKGWPLKSVTVTVEGKKEENTFLIDRRIELVGDLSEEQRARLLDIANKCPVHRTLTGTIRIDSKLVSP